MIKNICLYATIIVFLFASMHYQLYSKDRQLFHIHQIPRGSLSFSEQIAGSQQLKQIKNLNGISVEVVDNIKKLCILFAGSNIISAQNQNFIALLSSVGQIKSHGDSFYKIRDRHQKICTQQKVQSIVFQSQIISIKGSFFDCTKSQYQVKLSINHDKLEVHVSATSNQYNRLMVYFQHKQEQNYFGLGEQFSYLNLGHNRAYSLFVREKGVGRTDQPETYVLNSMYGAGKSYYNSYSPTPIWISSIIKTEQNQRKPTHIGYALLSWAYCIWMNNHIYVWDTSFKVEIMVTSSIKQLLRRISQINGYTPPVPNWVNEGAIVGLQGGSDSVIQKYQILKKQGTKVAGLWLQDWVSKRKSLGFSRLWWNWQLDKNHYSKWNIMRQRLQKENVSLLIYMNPMLTSVANKKQNYTTDYHKLAKEKQCFVKTKDGIIYQTAAFSDWKASMFDFKNSQEARTFYKQIFKNAIQETGARGLMVDFGEAFPVQKMGSSLQQAAKLHNEYPTIYHKVVSQILAELKDIEMYTFSRAGYLYAPKYTLSLWAGDQAMNFKKHSGLPSCLTAMLSSSLVGYSNTHCDIGGYSSYELPFQKTSFRTQILMTRWMQLAAFSPVFRTHEGNLPDSSLQVYSNEKIAAQFSFYSNVYSALADYRREQAANSQKLKLPLIRPFFVENQNDEEAYKISDQYFLGEDILVFPILTQSNKRKIYIPKGNWVNIWNMVSVQGCDCYLQHNEFLPSVLIKRDSVFSSKILKRINKILQQFKIKASYVTKSDKIQEL